MLLTWIYNFTLLIAPALYHSYKYKNVILRLYFHFTMILAGKRQIIDIFKLQNFYNAENKFWGGEYNNWN